jgi:hypothetical protein
MLSDPIMRTHKHSETRRQRRARTQANPSGTLPRPSIADLDPSDPTQELDEVGEFTIELAVEAQPAAEALEDFDTASEESDAEAYEDDPAACDEAEAKDDARDTGELYGVHVPPATDPAISAGPDHGGFEDADLGEDFFESLEEHAAELGAAPEHELDIVDDSDHDHAGHHKTDTRDRPVADKGSGGPAGV